MPLPYFHRLGFRITKPPVAIPETFDRPPAVWIIVRRSRVNSCRT
jgi:hypothetical protein